MTAPPFEAQRNTKFSPDEKLFTELNSFPDTISIQAGYTFNMDLA
jgi:hypothetical protein